MPSGPQDAAAVRVVHGRTYEDGRQAVSDELRAGFNRGPRPGLKNGLPGHRFSCLWCSTLRRFL